MHCGFFPHATHSSLALHEIAARVRSMFSLPSYAVKMNLQWDFNTKIYLVKKHTYAVRIMTIIIFLHEYNSRT